MKFDYQETIDKYVQGHMTPDERKAFEQVVQSNEELRDQLEFTKQVKTLITSRQEKMALLKQWEREHRMEEERVAARLYRATGTEDYRPAPSYQSAPKPTSKKLYYWISGIAAVLVIGFFVVSPLFIFNSPGSSDEQFRGDDDVFAPNDTLCTDSISNDSTYTFTDDCE